MATDSTTPVAYGTLATLFATPKQLAPHINPSLALNRAWYGRVDKDQVLFDDPTAQTEHLNRVKAAIEAVPEALLTSIHNRRDAAVRALLTDATSATFLTVTPMWRVVVGHGEHTIHESGLTLSTVHGLPYWPGTALKGLAAAYARAEGTPAETMETMFGSPRPEHPESPAAKASVTVLDALPTEPPTIAVDVLTPHVKPYYDQTNTPDATVTNAPGEYHSPVPVRFLAVGATPFRTAVIGGHDAVSQYVELLTAAFDDLGIGGKTAAGYGYATTERKTP